MAYTYTSRYTTSGPTSINNRTSWGPISTQHVDVSPKSFDRPLSGNFDRIINAFERTNAFEYVRNSFEHTEGNDAVFEKIFEKDKEVKEERFVGHGDIVVNRKKSSSYERADGNLARQTPCSEAEVADFYQERIIYSQARQLFPLQEDLADWINKTIGISYLTGENFLDVLDNGVELCQLATVIRDKAKEAVVNGQASGPVPTIKGRCWQRAARRSFFSRDNMENFITFCRELGVHENLLFESDDLVLHNQPRQVVLCLLEVARLATKYDIEPPGLVQLEKEIALEERDSGLDSAMSGVGWQFREATPVDERDGGIKNDPPPSPENPAIAREATFHVDSEDTPSEHGSADSDVPLRPTNELDKRVQIVTRLMERNCNCNSGKCSKLLKMKKVGEGRYNIAGRNVFIRLLKGRHMMVRVGGGWDTLEHFLSRHDPCQVRLVSQNTNRTDITTLDLLYPPATTATHTVLGAQNTVESDTSSRGSNLSVHSDSSHRSIDIGKISPISNKSGTTSPSERLQTRKTSPSNAKTKLSPANSKASLIGGKISPIEGKRSACGKNSPTASGSSGKISPLDHTINMGRRTSTPTKQRITKTLKQSLTLPLKSAINSDEIDGRLNPKDRTSLPSKTRKQSAPSSFSTPNTPTNRPAKTPTNENRKSFCGSTTLNSHVKKSRSMSLASAPKVESKKSFCGTDILNRTAKTRSVSLASTPTSPKNGFPTSPKNGFSTRITTGTVKTTRSLSLASTPVGDHKKTFCGTDTLNTYAKKTRSMSLASPVSYKSPTLNRSMSGTAKSLLSPSAIEESIRNSLSSNVNLSNKPFLHIKAKYRSPPPREVPPR